MYTVLVSGSLAYDRIMKFPGSFKDHFHADKMHALSVSFVVSSMEESFGGTAGNVAYNLHLLEERPTLVAAVGGDFAKYRDYLHGLKISAASTQVEQQIPTAVAHVITDDENNQISAFYAGAMARPYTSEIPEADLAIVSAGNPVDMVELSQKIRRKGIPFFYDPGQMITALSAEELRISMEGAEVLFGNDYEIAMLTKKTGWQPEELLQHVGAVVKTLGGKGTHVITKEKEFNVLAVSAIQVLDPTGAGDAYRAGFAKTWLAKKPLETCVKVASAVAVFAVEAYGTQIHTFTLHDVKKRYEDAYEEDFPL